MVAVPVTDRRERSKQRSGAAKGRLLRREAAAKPFLSRFRGASGCIRLLAGREQLSPGDHTAFWIKLPCEVYVSWEIEASLLDMIALIADPRSSDMSEVVDKVLGFGRD